MRPTPDAVVILGGILGEAVVIESLPDGHLVSCPVQGPPPCRWCALAFPATALGQLDEARRSIEVLEASELSILGLVALDELRHQLAGPTAPLGIREEVDELCSTAREVLAGRVSLRAASCGVDDVVVELGRVAGTLAVAALAREPDVWAGLIDDGWLDEVAELVGEVGMGNLGDLSAKEASRVVLDSAGAIAGLAGIEPLARRLTLDARLEFRDVVPGSRRELALYARRDSVLGRVRSLAERIGGSAGTVVVEHTSDRTPPLRLAREVHWRMGRLDWVSTVLDHLVDGEAPTDEAAVEVHWSWAAARSIASGPGLR
jgi:hypothetical protein